MKNDVSIEQSDITTIEYKQAVELHYMVIAAREQVGTVLLDFAKLLKSMRDGKQYLLLGYADFGDYIEKGVNIQKRQVYTYISTYERLGSDILQSNAQLGITKLALLSDIPDIDRADFIENNDLFGMSVKEIKELIKQSEEQIEQISLLSEQLADVNNKQIAFGDMEDTSTNLEEKLNAVTAELEELKSKRIDVAVVGLSAEDIERIKADAALDVEKTIKAQYEESRSADIKTATEKAEAAAQKDMLKQIESAKIQAASEAAEQYKNSLLGIEAEKAEAIKKAERLAKELDVAIDSDMTTIQFYLDELSELFNKITQKIAEIEIQDVSKANGLCGALANILTVLIEQVHGVTTDEAR